jgi:hypothetical protein
MMNNGGNFVRVQPQIEGVQAEANRRARLYISP